MLLKTDIPRPTFASVFSIVAEQTVLFWITKQKDKLSAEAYKAFLDSLPQGETQFRNLLQALSNGISKPDSFAYCESLKNVLDWPVDGELAAVFADAFKEINDGALRRETIAWVMKTGTRFDRKNGDDVTFYDINTRTNRRGKVVEVDRPTASAKIKVNDSATVNVLWENLVA